MRPTFNDKLIAYFTLFSGLAISGIAEYYSIMGLMAIYPTAIIPIVIMGVVLGIGKISGTVWLKQNWEWSPFFLKAYVLPAIIILMLITSLGVFGFLSKAHSDQTLVSGEVIAKIAVYDEKIRTEKENIDAARKALKQMDESVDQTMARSDSERGAERAIQVRRQQQAERARLQKDIISAQNNISKLSEERAPIAAEVRKVEAEVGPIKYIAHLLYGANPDANILEKAVIWVTVLIVIVLDPLAVVLLLASQYSFQRFRELEEDVPLLHNTVPFTETPIYVADVGEKPTEEEKQAIEEEPIVVNPTLDKDFLKEAEDRIQEKIEEAKQEEKEVEHKPDTHPYLTQGFKYPEGWEHGKPLVANPNELLENNIWIDDKKIEAMEHVRHVTGHVYEEPSIVQEVDDTQNVEPTSSKELINIDWDAIPPGQEYMEVNGQRMSVRAAKELYGPKHLVVPPGYVQNEEQQESGQWNKVITEQEYRAKAEQNIKNESSNNTNNAS